MWQRGQGLRHLDDLIGLRELLGGGGRWLDGGDPGGQTGQDVGVGELEFLGDWGVGR